MRDEGHYIALSVVLFLVASVLSGLSQASIINGDFSAVDADGYPILDPWIASGSVSNQGGYAYFTENTGGDKISSLTQMVTIPDGAQLSFNYEMDSHPVISGPPDSDTFYVYLGGVEIFSINNDSLAPHGGTISDTILKDVSSFAGPNVELKFVLLSDDAPDAVYTTTVELSNVDVESIPEPATLLLLGLGAVALRRKSS